MTDDMTSENLAPNPTKSVHSESRRGLRKTGGALGFAIASILFAERLASSPVEAQGQPPAGTGYEQVLSAEQISALQQETATPRPPGADETGNTFANYFPNVTNLGDARGNPIRPIATPDHTPTNEIPTSTATHTATVEPPPPTPELIKGELPQGLQVHEAPGSQARHHKLSAASPDSGYIGSYKAQDFTSSADLPQDYSYDLFRQTDNSLVAVRTGSVAWMNDENRFETTEEVWVENRAYEGESKFITNKTEDIFASGIRYNQMPTRVEFSYERAETERGATRTKQEAFDKTLGTEEQLEQHGLAIVAVEWDPGEKKETEVFSVTTGETGLTRLHYGDHSEVLFEAGVNPGTLVADLNWDGTEITVSQRQTDHSLRPLTSKPLDNPIPDNKTFLVGRAVSDGENVQINYSVFEKPDGIYDPVETLGTSETLEDQAAEKGMQMGVTTFWGLNYFEESRAIAAESRPPVDHFYLSAAVIDSPTASGRPNTNVIEYFKARGDKPDYAFRLFSGGETNGTQEQLHNQLDQLLSTVDSSSEGRFILAQDGGFKYSHPYSDNFAGSQIVIETNSYLKEKAPNLEFWYRVRGNLWFTGPEGKLAELISELNALGENKPSGIQLKPIISLNGIVRPDEITEFSSVINNALNGNIDVDLNSVTFSQLPGQFDVNSTAENFLTEMNKLSRQYPGHLTISNSNWDVDTLQSPQDEVYSLNTELLRPDRSNLYWVYSQYLGTLP